MNNEEFFARVKKVAMEKKGWSLYQLQKNVDENVLKESTFFTMFHNCSTPKLEYIEEISRVLGVSQAELIEPENAKNQLMPIQKEILSEFEGIDEKKIKEILPIIRGVIIAEKNR